MAQHRSTSAKSMVDEAVGKEAPKATPLPAVWPGLTRRRIALWDEFPEEATGRYGARENRPKVGDSS